MATASFTGDGVSKSFIMPQTPISINSVTVGGTGTTAYVWESDGVTITFNEAPSNEASIAVVYKQKLDVLRTLCGQDSEVLDDNLLNEYLDQAAEIILQKCYPSTFDVTGLLVPRRYSRLQCDIANELIQKRGAEGESHHNEDGVSRSYENSGISRTLLKRIVPFAHVLGTSSGE